MEPAECFSSVVKLNRHSRFLNRRFALVVRLMKETVLNAGQKGSDPLLAFKLSPGSSEEFNHRKTAEVDVDLLSRQFLVALRDDDGTTERIVRLLMQLLICHEFDFGLQKLARNLIEKFFQQQIGGFSEVCHEDSPFVNAVR